METLTNRVREQRVALGLSQEKLAHLVGVTRQTILSLEKGSYVPSLLLAMRLSEALNTPIENLFTKEDV